jgi:hypothetical protein
VIGPRTLAILGILCLVLGISVGATGATWRAKSACADQKRVLADEIATLTNEKHDLELAIGKANAAIEVAKAQTVAADAAREQAERHAADLAQFSQSRLDKLANAVATAKTCDDVLKSYWGIRQ